MIEIEIQNFQSIVKSELEVTGFTALVGRSNIGKSAIVRAIRCALSGGSGTDFVRHGSACLRRLKGNKKCKCQSSVKIKTPVMELLWEKGDSVNRYTIIKDSQENVYDSVGGGTPEFLMPDFEPVKIGSSTELVQVSRQFKPILLLDQSGPVVADVLSDVAQLDSINEAMRLVERDRKEALATKKVKGQDVVELSLLAASYTGLDEVLVRVTSLEKARRTTESLDTNLQKLYAYVVQVDSLETTCKQLEFAIKPELPDYEIVCARERKLCLLAGFQVVLLGIGTALKALKLATEVMLPEANLLAQFKKVEVATRLQLSLFEKLPILKQLSGIGAVILPGTEVLEKLGTKTLELGRWLDRVSVIKTSLTRWKDVDSSPELNIQDLTAIAVKHANLAKYCDSWAQELAIIEEIENRLTSVELVEREAFEAISKFTCPTCEQPINVSEMNSHFNGGV